MQVFLQRPRRIEYRALLGVLVEKGRGRRPLRQDGAGGGDTGVCAGGGMAGRRGRRPLRQDGVFIAVHVSC